MTRLLRYLTSRIVDALDERSDSNQNRNNLTMFRNKLEHRAEQRVVVSEQHWQQHSSYVRTLRVAIKGCVFSKWTMRKVQRAGCRAVLAVHVFKTTFLQIRIRSGTARPLNNTVESQRPQTSGAAKKTFVFGLPKESNELRRQLFRSTLLLVIFLLRSRVFQRRKYITTNRTSSCKATA